VASIITGDSESKYLTKVKKSKSGNEYNKKIYNPIKQVNTHIYKLSKILRENGVNIWIKGVVLFTNKDSIVKVDSNKILVIQSENCDKLINLIKNNNDIVLSKNDIEKVSKILNTNIV
jgi:esterase/lipase